MPDVTVGGVRFNTVRLRRRDVTDEPPPPGQPEGPPVVFLHGLIMDNLSSWYYTLAPTVALTHEVVCYDLRGHGRSDRPRSGYRLEDAVDDLFGVVDALGIAGPVHLVGNSFGGTIAIAAALWRPGRVAGLGLVEAHPAFPGWADEMVDDLEDLVEGFDDPGARERITAAAPRSLRRMVRTCEELVAGSTMPDDLLASRPTPPQDLADLACPTLLVYGDSSDILDRARQLSAAIPHAELHVVEGCSHALLMESPDAVAVRLVPWLARLSAGLPVPTAAAAPG
jgi:pimeloyl-ACP methyl ester carboxylesterase